MIIVADVGNTNIVLGAYENDRLLNFWRMSTGSSRTSDETGVFISAVLEKSGLSPKDVEDCIISSVVPDVLYSFVNGFRKYFGISPIIVNHKLKTNIKFHENMNTREVGSDRIVNCVAAYALYGGPAIVIDYGTATTYDAISAEGMFITGITAPGIKISAEALYEKTALLGKVEIVMPPSLLVSNTTESIQAGIVYGRIGETEYIVNMLKKELGWKDIKVIATGGLVKVISPGTTVLDEINLNLTLEGLRILYEMNVKSTADRL